MSLELHSRALAWNIYLRLLDAETDIVRVIDYILVRTEAGRAEHGDLVIATDSRDFAEEERQEHADLVVYRACDELKRLDEKRVELRAEAELELREFERHPAGGHGWDLSDLSASELGEGEG